MVTRNSNELIIDDSSYKLVVDHIKINGIEMGRGLIPRDYVKVPVGSMAGVPKINPKDIPVLDRSLWSDAIALKKKNQSFLSDIRLMGNDGASIPSLSQGQSNFCWAHSAVHAAIITRAVMNESYVPLSAFALACKIMNFQNKGGWCGLSFEEIMKVGVPDQAFWPQGSFSRSYDNQETWKNAQLHRVTEGWMDLDEPAYDRDLSFDQIMTLLILGIPVVVDFMWWGHSVLALDPIEFDKSLPLSNINRWGIRIWNSWGDEWSDRGMGLLRGNKARADGAVACRVVRPKFITSVSEALAV